jgi:outer membrane immunogenic protein
VVFSAAVVAAVSTTALTQIASAADQRPPVHKAPIYKAPPPAPAPVYTWTGWYVGGNVGGSWGNAHTDIVGSGSVIAFQNIPPGSPGFPSSIAFADSNNAHLNGVIGGVQFGYNYQFSPNWVLGVEADIQGSGQRGSNTFFDPFSATVCSQLQGGACVANNTLNGAVISSYDAEISWFGTVRARLGALIADQVLLYATGGLAYGEVKLSGSALTSASISAVSFTSPGTAFSASHTNLGFAVGGGLEERCSCWLPPNWTWKLEYLYVDLGSLDTSTSFAAASSNKFFSALAGTMATHTHFTDNIVRFGLNYKFDYAAAPAVYK